MSYRHRIRPDYRPIPLGANLKPTEPSEFWTRVLTLVCLVAVVLVVVAL